ncbi:MAG: SEC-C domain-containing protein [Chloroflexi bacterium]|nr:SEC-C domain-containing protein [Chloroflexota bacterium]
MNRPNWYEQHPTACTCVSCQKSRSALSKAGKVGRNQRCPCGSGKKYKKCHGG